MDSPEKPETLEVESLEVFVKLLGAWHKNRVDTLEHFMEIPEGTSLQLDEGVEIALTGEILAAFKAGILTALTQLGDLPFKVEFEDAPAA